MIAKHSAVLASICVIVVPSLVCAQTAAPAARAPTAPGVTVAPKVNTAAAIPPVAQAAPAAKAGAGAAVPAANAGTATAVPTQTATAPKPGAATAPLAAPATQPASAAGTAPVNVAGAASGTPGSGAATTASVLSPRETPKGRNPVMEAFTPQPQGLTARTVAKRAVASSHTIEAKNAELRAAAAKVDSAMYQFLPRVGLKASYSRVNPVKVSLGSGGGYLMGSQNPGPYRVGPLNAADPNAPTVLLDSNGVPVGGSQLSFPVITDYYSLGASLSVPISDYVLRLSNSIEGTKQNQQAAELNIKAERAKVEGDARVAFFNWARAIGQVAITENSIERVRARLKDVEASFTVGMVTKTEVLRLQSAVANTEAGLEAARAFRELAAQQLAVIMKDKAPNYTLGEDVLAQPNARTIEALEQLVAEAQKQRYEIQAFERTAESLERAESVIRAGQLPRLDGFANYDYANPNQRYFFTKAWHGTWAVGAQLTWSPNDMLMNRASGDEMAAQRAALIANRRALADGIRLEVTSAYTDARRAAAELEAAKRATEASQAAYDTATQLFKVGKATTSELIDSEGELVTSQLRLINAHIDTKVAETKLIRALGRDMNRLSD